MSIVRTDDPPDENSGNGTPTTGKSPTTMPKLMKACQKIIAPMPIESTAPKRSFDCDATRIAHTLKNP
jgi:hypothetical protein